MAVKMTGKQFKAFYDDPAVWGPRDAKDPTYCDATVISVDGEEMEDWDCDKIDDAASVVVMCGDMLEQGRGIPNTFDGAARWWLKRQSTVSFVVECHKDAREAVEAAVKAAGGKVL